jgi:hypothetical protein
VLLLIATIAHPFESRNRTLISDESFINLSNFNICMISQNSPGIKVIAWYGVALWKVRR